MQKRQENVTNSFGNSIPGAFVTVNIKGGGLATLFKDDGTSQANPITADALGGYSYRAANGHYSESVSLTLNGAVVGGNSDVTLFDPADLLALGGALIVKYRPAFTGSVATPLQTKAIETVSILETGGADDFNGSVGTNNFAALEQLCALRPITIKFPRTNTGRYLINGTTSFTDLTGVTLDADEGVSIYIQGAGLPQPGIPGIKVKRHLAVYYEPLRYSKPLGSHMFVKPSEKAAFMTAGDGELHKPIALDFTADAYSAKLAAWPSGALARYTPTSTSATAVVHPAPGSVFAGTLVAVAPGDQIYAQITTSANFPGVMIQTEAGWMVAWTAVGDPGVSTMELQSGTGVGLSTIHSVLSNASYRFDKAMLGVMIYDERNFGLMVNGVLIKRYTTFSNIVAAGWSGGFGAAAFTISNPVLIRNKKTAGIKPLKLVCIGDSISADTMLRSHFRLAAQYLTGMGGFQLDTMTNLAVAGETSAQQLARLQATTITNYDYCLIQIGVNDIQTATAVATFTANITAMVAYCRASQVTPIVGIPTMWYAQVTAQAYAQDGAATDGSNESIGASYRLALLRTLASLGVHVNMMVIEDEGAVIASLLTLAGADPVVCDNIHPTVYGSMLMGYSWAKAIAAHIVGGVSDIAVTTFMDAAWFINPTNPTTVPSYTINGGNFIPVGYLSKGASAWANATVLGALPRRFWPANTIVQSVTCSDSGGQPLASSSCITVDAGGVMRIYNIPASTAFVSFSGNWRI